MGSGGEAIMREMMAATVDMENVSRHLAEANRLLADSGVTRDLMPHGILMLLDNTNAVLAQLNGARDYLGKMLPRDEEGGGDETTGHTRSE